MPDIFWIYFICLFCVLLIAYTYFRKTKEGYESSNNADKCEYKLQVEGLLDLIPRVYLYLFGVNILEPINGIIDMINEIIKIINLVIIAVDFFATKFIGCLLFFLLNGFGLGLWGLLLGIFALLSSITGISEIKNIPNIVHTWLDENVDAPLYKYTGTHIIHYPTIIQNRCYHWDGNNRIPCWTNPFESNDGKKNGTGLSNDISKNLAFYNLLCSILLTLFMGLCIYAGIYYLVSYLYSPPECQGTSCK